MPLELRIAETEQDAVLAFRAYKQMYDEGLVPGSFHGVKVLTRLLRMVQGPGSCVFMVMDDDKLAGVVSLWREPYWYGFDDDLHLADKGLYVLPEYRDGEAFQMLLDAAQNASDTLGLPCFLTVFNFKRRRGGRSKWERLGATLGWPNRGAVIAHFPEK